MHDRRFGWDYPPGVTGNEPQIAGPPEGDDGNELDYPEEYMDMNEPEYEDDDGTLE